MLVLAPALCMCVCVCILRKRKTKQNRSPFQSGGPFSAFFPYLLLDVVDIGSQPLDHPVHLGDLMLGVAEIVVMPARSLLQLLVLMPPEKRKESIYMRMETLSQVHRRTLPRGGKWCSYWGPGAGLQ